VSVGGVPVIRIDGPEEVGAPFRLSANFTDETGALVFQIRANEWRANSSSWDAAFAGGRIVIRQQPGTQSLVLRAQPPHGIAIERIQARIAHVELRGDSETLRVTTPTTSLTFTGGLIEGGEVGLAL
jgi:hypothetical protein